MEEKLSGYYQLRIEESLEEELRNLPRETRHELRREIRQILEKYANLENPVQK